MWKFAGLAPEIKWSEFDFEKVFASGRETFGEQEEDMVAEEVRVTAGINGDAAAAMPTEEGTKTLAENEPPNGHPATEEEAPHSATRVESTIEQMPVQEAAKMMAGMPENQGSLPMAGMVHV